MNPPFTRDSLRHDQFNTRRRTGNQGRREKEVLGRSGNASPVARQRDGMQTGLVRTERAAARLQGSSGGVFTVLAEKMLRDDGGTLALVLPSVVPIRRRVT